MSGENVCFEDTNNTLQPALLELRPKLFSGMTLQDKHFSEDPSAGDLFRSNFREKVKDWNDFRQKFSTSSSSRGNSTPKLRGDGTILSSITMEESRSGTSILPHLSEDESSQNDVDQVSLPESVGSNLSDSFASTLKSTEDSKWSSQWEVEMTCTNLKRLLAKFGNPFGAPLPNNPGALFLILENHLEESKKTIEELKQIVRQKDEEMAEANKAMLERQDVLIQEHRKRVSLIVKDHEGHLSASIERAMNARRQTAGIQMQLALATSKLEMKEKEHRDKCDSLMRNYTSKINSLMEEIYELRTKEKTMATTDKSEIAVVENVKSECLDVTLVRSVPESNAEVKEAEKYLTDLPKDFLSPRWDKYKTEKTDALHSDIKEEPVLLKSTLLEKVGELEDVAGKLAKVKEDIAAKNRDVEKSSAQILVLDSKLTLLDSQIKLLSTEVLKRDDILRVLQYKVEEKDVLLRLLSKKVKAEKRRSSQLSLSVTVTKEQEKQALEKLRSLQRDKDHLDGQCTIRQSQVSTLSDILQSREKMIVQLQRELENTDAQLSKLFDHAADPFSSSPDFAIAARSGLLSSSTNGDDTSTNFMTWDMSLESSLDVSPIYCSSDSKTTSTSSSQDGVAAQRRVEWLGTTKIPSSFDTDSGISTIGSSLNAAVHTSAVPDLIRQPSHISKE